MAKFRILRKEGMRYVKATLDKETIYAEAGALCYMVGDITMHAGLPSLDRVVNSSLAEESIIRPAYSGTGEVVLQPSFGGFHVLEMTGQPWVLHSGAFFAADGTVGINAFREKVLPSLWAGEGLIDFNTRVSGQGQVILRTPGPVKVVDLKDSRLVAAGKHVLARTQGLSYSVQRPTKTYLGRFLAQEDLARVYEGTGQLLVSFVPYWRYRMFLEKAKMKKRG